MNEIVKEVLGFVAIISGLANVLAVIYLTGWIISRFKRRKTQRAEKAVQKRIEKAIFRVSMAYERKIFIRERAFELEKQRAVDEAVRDTLKLCDNVFKNNLKRGDGRVIFK